MAKAIRQTLQQLNVKLQDKDEDTKRVEAIKSHSEAVTATLAAYCERFAETNKGTRALFAELSAFYPNSGPLATTLAVLGGDGTAVLGDSYSASFSEALTMHLAVSPAWRAGYGGVFVVA
jgi:hypothetical protein